VLANALGMRISGIVAVCAGAQARRLAMQSYGWPGVSHGGVGVASSAAVRRDAQPGGFGRQGHLDLLSISAIRVDRHSCRLLALRRSPHSVTAPGPLPRRRQGPAKVDRSR
jgi:hypothetical protein